MKFGTGALGALLITTAALVLPASALAWHADASIQCTYGQAPKVTATFTYGFPNGGPWEARERILQVNTITDEWTPLPLDQAPASQPDKTYVWANGMNSNLQPATVTTPMSGNGGTFAAKAQWYGDDAGFAKSTIQTCAPPVPTCTGTTVPAGSPMPVCRPECNGSVTVIPPGQTIPPVVCPSPPPPTTPPSTVQSPAPPKAMPPARCIPVGTGKYHLVRKGLVVKLRGGPATRVRVWNHGKVVGHSRTIKMRRGAGVYVFRFRVNACTTAVLDVVAPARHHHPRFTG